MIKIFNNKKGVSEVVGVIIMLGIAIALFSVVYLMAINFPFNEPNPYVRLSATYDNDDNAIIIVHQGGVNLSRNTNIIVVIDGDLINETVDQLVGYNGSSWNIGEKLQFNLSEPLANGQEARITVVDAVSNSVVMQGKVRGDEQP